MRKLLLLLLFAFSSFPAFSNSNLDSWYGKYHYESSEELSAENVATMEIELNLTSRTCRFNVSGFQVYENYKCRVNEKNGSLYIYDLKSRKGLGKVVKKNKKYYIYSDEVLDPKDNAFFKEK